jgi:hypothetical protein
VSKVKVSNNIAEKYLNDEKLIKENECQRQDFSQLQFINKILEEHKNNFGQNNEGNDQTRVKEKGEKNHKTKGMSKKRNGIDSKPILKCTAQKVLNINFN